MIIDINSEECLICLEKCKNKMIFECCGEYLIHDKCYKKWKETNKICIICRNPVTENDTIEQTNFLLYYVALARIKIIVSCYCYIMGLIFLFLLIKCDFKKDYCDLM